MSVRVTYVCPKCGIKLFKEAEMPEEKRCLYGDGKTTVLVTKDEVIISELAEDEGPYHVVSMSHATFRELVSGWQRHEAEERGQ